MRRNVEALALLEYRQGHYMEAIGWCYRHGMDSIDARTATTSLIKALSGWRLAGYKEAAANWNQAYELIHASRRKASISGVPLRRYFQGHPKTSMVPV